MVNIVRCFRFISLLLLLGAFVARAKDLAAYNIGDTADEDITTPVAFDAVDPVATAAKRAAEAAKTPTIFRYCPPITNDVINDFLAQFDASHKNFLKALEQKFQQTTLDDQTIVSPDFDIALGAFNKKNKAFPLTTNLAKLWARGDSGQSVQKEILKRFAEAMRRPIHADTLPDGLELGQTIRIVTVKILDQPLTIADVEAHGKSGTQSSVTTLTHTRSILRKLFPDDEQITAHAMMALLKPTAVADDELTRQSRDDAVAQISVPIHYDAGQIVVRKGETIDTKIKAALDQLAKNDAATQMIKDQAKKAQELAAKAQQQAQLEQAQAKKIEQQAALEKQEAIKTMQQSRSHEAVLFAEISGVAVFAILAVVVVLYLTKKTPAVAAQTSANGQRTGVAPASPAPQTAKKSPPSAMPFKVNIPPPSAPKPLSPPTPLPSASQELPAGAMGLQEAAEAEILQLTQRLDKIYAPPHDRLRTYQLRLEDFERELAQHGVQNPELLQLKIATLQRQMEIERKRFRL